MQKGKLSDHSRQCAALSLCESGGGGGSWTEGGGWPEEHEGGEGFEGGRKRGLLLHYLGGHLPIQAAHSGLEFGSTMLGSVFHMPHTLELDNAAACSLAALRQASQWSSCLIMMANQVCLSVLTYVMLLPHI